MIKDDSGRLTELDQIVEYQITTLDDNKWHLFFFTRQGKTRKFGSSYRKIEQAIEALNNIIKES